MVLSSLGPACLVKPDASLRRGILFYWGKRRMSVNEQEAVQKFIDQVRWLYEPEFGDFKRKLGLYIQRLEKENPGFKNGDGRQVLDTMKSTVVYNPNGDIESTRREVLQLAAQLLGSTSGPLH
jgi:hypothetical protein